MAEVKRNRIRAAAEAAARGEDWDRRDVTLHVSDHAVLRYLERRHGIDIAAVRRHLAGMATTAAELGAVAVRSEGVRLFLRDRDIGRGRVLVTVATVGTPDMRRGLGVTREDAADD